MSESAGGSRRLLDSPLVVELGDRVGVGAAGNLLVQLGAQVILIEPRVPRSDHKWRNRPICAAGKHSLVLDRTDAKDTAQLQALIERADILILSSDITPADQKLWDTRARDLIVCDITAFGHTGPLAGTPFSEELVEAVGATLDTTGPLERPPVPIGTPVLEMQSAMFATSAAVSALRVKRLHHFGQRIDVALFDIAVTSLINFLPLEIIGKTASRSGNRHPLYAPWGTYRAKDGWILICAVTNDHWQRVCEAMGAQHLVLDNRFATSSARLDNFKLVDQLVGAWVCNLTIAECEKQLNNLGIACGPIVEVKELADHPNLIHRQAIRSIVDPVSGNVMKVPASPIRGVPVNGFTPDAIPEPDAHRAPIHELIQRRSSQPARTENIEEPAGVVALSGIRVIEIGQYTVAPMASRILGALGADVIKVEPPTGDAIRRAAPLREDGLAYIFALSNTDKRGIILDLRSEDDRETLHRLLDTADILVENLKPGSLAKLGFGSDNLRRRHPRLIYCSVNGFGTDSIYPGRAALDTVIQAMSGLMSLTVVDGVPTKAGISVSDTFGGEFSLLALLAALECRDRTGEAVHFDLSMQDASAWATQYEWNGGRSAPPLVELIEASDGYVAVEADRRIVTARLENLAANKPQKTANLSRDAIVDALSPDLRAAAVLTVAEVLKHPQVSARELILTCPTADGDSWPAFATPFKMLSTPAVVRSVMPRLGFTDAAVRAELDARDTKPSAKAATA